MLTGSDCAKRMECAGLRSACGFRTLGDTLLLLRLWFFDRQRANCGPDSHPLRGARQRQNHPVEDDHRAGASVEATPAPQRTRTARPVRSSAFTRSGEGRSEFRVHAVRRGRVGVREWETTLRRKSLLSRAPSRLKAELRTRNRLKAELRAGFRTGAVWSSAFRRFS
jgi:hypothetical protein